MLDALGAQQVDQRPQLLADLRVQADGRLVEQDSRGWCTSPRAISSRRRMPPESLSTFVSRRSVEVGDLERALDGGLALARAATR